MAPLGRRQVGPLIPFLLLYRAVAIVRLATARRHLERDGAPEHFYHV